MKLHVKSASFSTDNGQTSRFPFLIVIPTVKTSSQNISIKLLQILLKLCKHRDDRIVEKSSCERFCKVPSAENFWYCWSKIGNGMISMLWQLRSHCNPDHDKFSTTVVAIFLNVSLWRRSLCSNLVLSLKNCIETPSYASTAYVVAIWPSFLFDSFVKIWDTCENLGKWFTAPPGKKFPVRLCSDWSIPDHVI